MARVCSIRIVEIINDIIAILVRVCVRLLYSILNVYIMDSIFIWNLGSDQRRKGLTQINLSKKRSKRK